MPSTAYGEDVIKRSYNNRIVIEQRTINKFTNEESWYYSVQDITSKIENIRNTKDDVVVITKYPMWYDQSRIREEYRNHGAFILKQFAKIGSKEKIKQSIILIDFLLDDAGVTLCNKISSKQCLFNVYSTKELLEIFDNICTYRYTTPIFRSPKTGYTTSKIYLEDVF